jgi:AcrR family transcriptional regulator
MRSGRVEPVDRPTDPGTATDRIRLAAMRMFAEVGFEGASIRRIAEAAGVSPALVMHHYGSKAGLRTACDEYARSATHDSLGRLVTLMSGTQPATDAVLEEPAPTLLAYVARAVVDGTPAGDRLMDDVVSAVAAVQDESVADGVMADTDDRVMRAVLLTLYDLAPVILARHVARLTGSDPHSPEGFARVARAAMALYDAPLFTQKGLLSS